MKQLRRIVIACSTIALLGGCHDNPVTPESRVQANRQWNATRASVLVGLAADQLQSGNLDRCQETLGRALMIEKDSVPLHVLSAKLAIEQGKLELAEAHLKEAGRLDPTDAEVDYLAGVISQRWQQPERARAAYAVALTKDPTELSYLLAEAEMLVWLNQPDSALKLLQAKEAFFEHSGVIRDEIGMLLREQHQDEQALAELREAALLAADDPSIREHLALALVHDRQYPEAETQLDRLLKDPAFADRADLLAARGECLSQTNRLTESQTSYEAATKLDPTSGPTWVALAKVTLQLDDLPAADRAARKAISLAPGSADAQCLLGYIRLKQNRLSQSLAAFALASTLSPSDSTSVCLQGMVEHRMGRNEEAHRAYARALQINPQDKLATYLLAAGQN